MAAGGTGRGDAGGWRAWEEEVGAGKKPPFLSIAVGEVHGELPDVRWSVQQKKFPRVEDSGMVRSDHRNLQGFGRRGCTHDVSCRSRTTIDLTYLLTRGGARRAFCRTRHESITKREALVMCSGEGVGAGVRYLLLQLRHHQSLLICFPNALSLVCQTHTHTYTCVLYVCTYIGTLSTPSTSPG